MLVAAPLSTMISGGTNSAIERLMNGHVNGLLGPAHIWISLSVDFEEAFETVTTIDDSKWTTSACHERTTLLFYHVIQRAEGANTGNQREIYCVLAVIEALIPGELVQSILVVLLYNPKGMSNLTDLRNAHFHPLVIFMVESS